MAGRKKSALPPKEALGAGKSDASGPRGKGKNASGAKNAKPRSTGVGTSSGSAGARKRTPKRRRQLSSTAPIGHVRIQKFLADVGIASRRAAEELVAEGRVDVNGQTVTELPVFVDPKRDEIRVDGGRVSQKLSEPEYWLLNKPRGVVCSSRDELGRKTAVDLLGPVPQSRVHCVGRLDADSTGLIILTNDGTLTQHLTHPSHEVAKTYVVTVAGRIEGDELEKLKKGVYLDGKRTAGAAVKILQRGDTNTMVEITLREGRNREIRRMLLRLGHKVRKLRRVAIGPVTDKGLKTGNFRALTRSEVAMLRRAGARPE